jgi:hypothetical protein
MPRAPETRVVHAIVVNGRPAGEHFASCRKNDITNTQHFAGIVIKNTEYHGV